MENNLLQTFNNDEFGNIRILTIDNEPWFVGKDIAFALGYNDTDQAIRKHVEKEDKLTRQIDGVGQKRNITVINESGMYALIFGSKLPNAKNSNIGLHQKFCRRSEKRVVIIQIIVELLFNMKTIHCSQLRNKHGLKNTTRICRLFVRK